MMSERERVTDRERCNSGDSYCLNQGVACLRGYSLTAKQYNRPSPPELFSAAELQPLESWVDAQAAKS